MTEYIVNILPRIREFSLKIDKEEVFIEKPWVMFENAAGREIYIFKRNKDLIMSLNGQVQIGSWQFLPEINGILIDRIHNKILLTQEYVDQSIMVLKLEGITNEYFCFVNETFLSVSKANQYLKSVYNTQNHIREVELEDGLFLELLNCDGIVNYNIVRIKGQKLNDGIVRRKDSELHYLIVNSKIEEVLVYQEYKTNLGIIQILREQYMNYKVGDSVFKDGMAAPDGIYNLAIFSSLLILRGRINKKIGLAKYFHASKPG